MMRSQQIGLFAARVPKQRLLVNGTSADDVAFGGLGPFTVLTTLADFKAKMLSLGLKPSELEPVPVTVDVRARL